MDLPGIGHRAHTWGWFCSNLDYLREARLWPSVLDQHPADTRDPFKFRRRSRTGGVLFHHTAAQTHSSPLSCAIAVSRDAEAVCALYWCKLRVTHTHRLRDTEHGWVNTHIQRRHTLLDRSDQTPCSDERSNLLVQNSADILHRQGTACTLQHDDRCRWHRFQRWPPRQNTTNHTKRGIYRLDTRASQ